MLTACMNSPPNADGSLPTCQSATCRECVATNGEGPCLVICGVANPR
ncbi:MAG: hypothetical protein HYY06_19225 [Deltaproteobacteria bacterium]|nr:hypothetical protein [Deltaproteobacteria bacterium]